MLSINLSLHAISVQPVKNTHNSQRVARQSRIHKIPVKNNESWMTPKKAMGLALGFLAITGAAIAASGSRTSVIPGSNANEARTADSSRVTGGATNLSDVNASETVLHGPAAITALISSKMLAGTESLMEKIRNDLQQNRLDTYRLPKSEKGLCFEPLQGQYQLPAVEREQPEGPLLQKCENEPKHESKHESGPIEKEFRAQKHDIWNGVGSSSWTNICDPLGKDGQVRDLYVEMDQAAGEEGEKVLKEIGYAAMLEEAEGLGLKLGSQGRFVYKEGMDQEKLDQLNAKQFEGMKVGKDACEARRANKQISREVTSACSNFVIKTGDLFRSGSIEGFNCDHYAKVKGYNAMKLVNSAKKTNGLVNAIMKWFSSFTRTDSAKGTVVGSFQK